MNSSVSPSLIGEKFSLYFYDPLPWSTTKLRISRENEVWLWLRCDMGGLSSLSYAFIHDASLFHVPTLPIWFAMPPLSNFLRCNYCGRLASSGTRSRPAWHGVCSHMNVCYLTPSSYRSLVCVFPCARSRKMRRASLCLVS